MADSPNQYMPEVPQGPTAPASAGQAVDTSQFTGTCPTTPGAQAADPGTPSRLSQPTTMRAEDTSGEME